MNRKFSLLYATEEPQATFDILYDLSIDRAMHRITTDKRRTDYFLEVLRHPLMLPENIRFRQEILEDFRNNPELSEKLALQFTRYDRIRSDWQEMKLGAPPAAAASNPEALLDHTYASLKVTAFFPATISAFFSGIHELLCKYDIHAKGLCAMRDYCAEMIKNEALSEIVRIASLFRYHTPEYFTFDLAVTLDETLRASAGELCGSAPYEEKSKLALSLEKLLKKKEQGPPTRVEVAADGTAQEDALYLLGEGLGHIDGALTRITNNLYDLLFGLSREMYFYETALALFDHLEELEIPTCIPEILPAEADILEIHAVRDLVLASTGVPAAQIIPNDMEIGALDGVLVKGLTDTGKTVYLRSCGTAMLFAQVGLPVLASSARLSIRTAFFSHFSSAEEEFLKGDVTGRFDQEAREIAAILDQIRPHSLVMLNETFQTTSYTEGTDAIYHILQILPRVPAKYLFVTHLTGLFDRMDPSAACLMETDPGKQYKLKRILPNVN